MWRRMVGVECKIVVKKREVNAEMAVLMLMLLQ